MKPLIALIFPIAVVVLAQTPTAAPTFEVASVKLNKSGSHNMSISLNPGGRYSASNITVRNLITNAYDIRDFQLTGGPSWINSDHYDIDAKAEVDPAKKDDLRTMTEQQRKAENDRLDQMIQSLLAERFKLAFHKESKESTVYWLVVAKNGLKIKELPPPPPEANDPSDHKPPSRGFMRMGPGELHGQGVKLAFLLNSLAGEVGHPVLDKTDLKGDYDLDLKWTPDRNHSDSSDDSSGASIFTALQEQLGLKLEPHKAPVDVIVIDHIEKATEN